MKMKGPAGLYIIRFGMESGKEDLMQMGRPVDFTFLNFAMCEVTGRT